MTQTIGSRRQVWNGTAKRTSGGLTKSDLMMSHGRIVSKSKHFSAKKEMRLLKYGYGTQKGKFGYVKVGSKKNRKGSKKMKGGSGYSPLTPASVDSSYMMGDVVPQQFSPLDRALVGGKRRNRMRGGRGYPGYPDARMKGGSKSTIAAQQGGAMPLKPADVGATAVGGLMADGPVIGLTSYQGAGSTDVQLAAGQAGGRSRKHSKRHSIHKAMGIRKYMGVGGTTNRLLMPAELSELPGSPLARALGAS
jgi:hypothetical protein